MKAIKALPVPAFFNSDNAGKHLYRPDQRKVFLEAQNARKQYGLSATAMDQRKVLLLLIDTQKDFCFPEGSLYVGGRSGTGAIDDSRRTAEFIYRNLNVISQVATTMDTHFAFQIFSPAFLVDDKGAPLQPFDLIMGDRTIMRMGQAVGKAEPSMLAASVVANGNLGWLKDQFAYYSRELEKGGKYPLTVWPEHCILGSDGHALVGVIHEARMFHAYARGSQNLCETKGGHPLFECYSVYGGEVRTRFDGKPMKNAQKNTKFIEENLTFDRIIFGGQAGSHCVKASIADFLLEIVAKDPALAKKIYVVKDLMSAVTVPNPAGGFFVDYTPDMENALDSFANAGMHVVESTTPVEDWPGFMQ